MKNQEHIDTKHITDLVLKAAEKAYKETDSEAEPQLTKKINWPIECVVGPGLEGAIACESKIGYVNGKKGWLIYRGYNIFDLCAHSTFEEVCYLLLFGDLPNKTQLENFRSELIKARPRPETLRGLFTFPLEKMSAMALLRVGTNFLRQEFTYEDKVAYKKAQADHEDFIATDEDSIPMETKPKGEKKAIYEFKKKKRKSVSRSVDGLYSAVGLKSCYNLISGVAAITAAVARLHRGSFPIEPNPELSYAGNLLYMINGKEPTPAEERIMDIMLILHADHGMNASTFAAMVVASTLSDLYFSVGSGISALNGPLHGGANEQVLKMLKEIGSKENVTKWYRDKRKNKEKITGFGHRVYKAYDPRARVLQPIAKYLSEQDPETKKLFDIASELEKEVVSSLGSEKGVFPNVDYYSGLVYHSLGVPSDIFTPLFAVSRVSGWIARVMEYLENNRIFRPRATYIGTFDKEYEPLEERA